MRDDPYFQYILLLSLLIICALLVLYPIPNESREFIKGIGMAILGLLNPKPFLRSKPNGS